MPSICKRCSRKFVTKYTLQRHFNSFHEKEPSQNLAEDSKGSKRGGNHFIEETTTFIEGLKHSVVEHKLASLRRIRETKKRLAQELFNNDKLYEARKVSREIDQLDRKIIDLIFE